MSEGPQKKRSLCFVCHLIPCTSLSPRISMISVHWRHTNAENVKKSWGIILVKLSHNTRAILWHTCMYGIIQQGIVSQYDSEYHGCISHNWYVSLQSQCCQSYRWHTTTHTKLSKCHQKKLSEEEVSWFTWKAMASPLMINTISGHSIKDQVSKTQLPYHQVYCWVILPTKDQTSSLHIPVIRHKSIDVEEFLPLYICIKP